VTFWQRRAGPAKKSPPSWSRNKGANRRAEFALVMPLFESDAVISSAAVLESWSALWPGYSCTLGEDSTEENVFVFDCDGHQAFVTIIPVSVASVVTFAENSWLWQRDLAELESHGQHAIVMVSGGRNVSARFVTATRLLASIAALPGCVGIYVGGAQMVIQPDLYVAIADDYEPELPDQLWINIVGDHSNGLLSITTRGLDSFGTLELEIVDSSRTSEEVSDFIMIFAGYLVENGPVINAGETIGQSETERYVISVEQSRFDPSRQVLRINDF
jgi:hypothetical protein